MASESPLEILMDWQLLIAMEITCSPSVHPASASNHVDHYTTAGGHGKPHGKTHQSGVTFRQRLPFSWILVYCET